MATTTVSNKASFSVPSLIAVITAIWSFYAGAFFGMILAVVAILSGLLGVMLALSPSVRGGVASIVAVLAGGIGVVAAIIKAVMWILS